jgi:hypothetical protein
MFFHIHSPLKKFVPPRFLVVENVQIFSDLSLIGRKNKGFNFSVAKFFASGGEIRERKRA